MVRRANSWWPISPKLNLMQPIVPILMVSLVTGLFYHKPSLISQAWLEEAIQHHLIPALTGHPPCSSVEGDLLSLPVHMGGMGIVNPASMSQCVFEGLVRATSPLVDVLPTKIKTKKWTFSKYGSQGVNTTIQS